MRKLITILVIFFCIKSFGQPTTTFPYLGAPRSTAFVQGWLRVDSGFLNALKDTILAPVRVGEQRFRVADSTTYIARSIVADQKWSAFGSGSNVDLAFTTIAYAASINADYNDGPNRILTLTGDAAVTFSNLYNGAFGTWIIIQDGVGGHELTVPDVILNINTGVGDTTVIAFTYDGTTMYWTTSAGGGGTWGSITGTLSNQTDLQTALNAKISTTLTNGSFLVGNGSNVATAVAPTGDVTFTNAGIFAIGSGKVTNTMLAGSIDLTTKVTGVLPSANGGTGVNNSTRTLTINTNSGTLAFGNASKTLTINNSITLTGTDATVMTFPTTTATIARTDAAQTFTGVQTLSSAPVLSTASLTANSVTHTFPSVAGTVVEYKETTEASNATPTPTGDARVNWLQETALATAPTFAAPSGTPANHNELYIRILDNGTLRVLAWNAIYRASPDLPLPTTTVTSKTMYLKFVYNSASSTWDLIGYINNF